VAFPGVRSWSDDELAWAKYAMLPSSPSKKAMALANALPADTEPEIRAFFESFKDVFELGPE
jgi:hypothetical protein